MKKVTKKIYAILLIILMLINYMPVISRAVEYNMILALESTASKYVKGDEILVDIKVCELKEIGDIVQFAAKIEYNHNDLDLVDMIVTEEGYGVEKNIAESVIVVSKSMGEGTIGEGDIVATLKFNAKKSSETETTIKLTEIDSTCNSGDVYFNDVNEPEITLPVKSLHSLKITKTDIAGEAIQNNSALFKVEDLNGQKIYIETAEDGTAVIDNLKMPNSEGTHIYKIKEIVAPTGYVLNEEETSVTVTFNQNGTISTVDTNNSTVSIIEETNTIDIKISNEAEIIKPKQEAFNLVLNKVNEEGQSITGSTAEFTITMPDGTNSNYATNIETGKTQNIPLVAPETEGTYAYIIKENKAPEGYVPENSNIIALLKFEQQENKIVLISGKILSENSEEILPEVQDETKTITLNIKNNQEKEEPTPTQKFNIQIDGVNRENEKIEDGTTVLKITDKATNEVIYKEVPINNGKIELEMPAIEGTKQYEVEQIKAPEGYEINKNKITIEVEFEKNTEDKLEIKDYTVQGTDSKKGETQEKDIVSIIVVNEEIVVEPQKQNYSIEINKLDSETMELITTSPAVFTLITYDAKIKDYATTNGQTTINDLVPLKVGEEAIYVIKEKTAPEGYKTVEKSIVIKVSFEEQNGLINVANSQILLGEELATVEVLENTIKLNILNEKAEDEDLYVVSRKYEDGTDIYDLFTTYTGRHYTINSPFIDTKVAKLGNNITIQEFINNLESNGKMKVYDEQGNPIDNSERVKTKMILKATKGKQELTFTIVIKGDSDGDGRVRTKDLDMLIKHIAVEKVLTNPIELRALDLVVEPGDGIIRTTDLNRYYKIIAREQI